MDKRAENPSQPAPASETVVEVAAEVAEATGGVVLKTLVMLGIVGAVIAVLTGAIFASMG